MKKMAENIMHSDVCVGLMVQMQYELKMKSSR